jgi:hypothetical protein
VSDRPACPYPLAADGSCSHHLDNVCTCHPGCRTEPDGIIQHGWSCPEADPMADVLSAMVGPPLDNPILEESRQAILRRWLQ